MYKIKIFIISFMVIYTLLLIAPLYSDSLSVDQKKLNIISANARFNELESQDGYNIGVTYARQIGSFKAGFGLEKHTLLSGLWMGFDLRYQKYNSKKGFGIYYAKWLDEEDKDIDYVHPFIVYMSITLIPPLERLIGINLEIRPGFDFQYLNPPKDALMGPLTGIIYGSTISIIFKY